MTSKSPGLEPVPSRLSDFLRTWRDEIIADWTERVRALSPARDLSHTALVDHLPEILERIAAFVESVHTGMSASLGDLPKKHAVDRLGRGFDLDQVVTEYALLHRSVLDLWESRIGSTIDLSELRHLATAFDESVRQAAVRYAQARERLLKALDRISEAALGSSDLDAFLNELLRATLERTESVNTAVVLLREGDVLRVRAAVGLEDDLDRGFSLTMGEGFAGQVAARGEPVLLRHAAADPVVKSEAIRRKGIRALYGVPLMREDKVIGVAHIGSLTADEFSDEDKLLFRTMVSRATSVIVQAQLVADLRRAETYQHFLSDASKQLAESLDYHQTLGRIARLAVPAIADWCVVHLKIDETIRLVSIAHADPAKEQLVKQLQERYPIDPDAPGGVAGVLRTGRAEWRPEISEAQLSAVARDPDHLRMVRELGLKSYIVVPIVSRQRLFGTIALVTAESRRRYSEADLMLAEELAQRVATAIENAELYTDAQKAVQLREQVLAIVSHDLRNQLGVVVMGANQLARKTSGPGGADIARPIDTIQRTANRMQHLVGDLLDMASIQAGRLAIERQVAELKPILMESLESHESLARERSLHLQIEWSVDGLTVLCDRARIVQVLGNLLGNAIKFCEPGDTIAVRAEARDTEAVIAVSDTGPGIPAEEREGLFEPYRTIEREGKGGTGLGLYITKGIVERHGGRIWVEGEVGTGTTFVFTLPRA